MDPYEEREPDDVRILWGRVVVLGGALLLAFLLGMWVSGDDQSVDMAEHRELAAERDALEDQVAELEDQIDLLSEGEAPAGPSQTSETDGDDAEDDAETDAETDDSGDPEGQIYTVRSGDTLSSIALRFYGNPGQDARERIAEANDIEPDATLRTGEELLIPPAES